MSDESETPSAPGVSGRPYAVPENPTGGDAEGPRCRCGFGLEHPWVTPKLKYSPMGYLSMFFGITATPREVLYVCWQCEEVVHRSTDPGDLVRHRDGTG